MEGHLKEWVQVDRELGRKAKKRRNLYGNRPLHDNEVVLYHDKRKPLTIEDYLDGCPFNIIDPTL
jgi:hypothetical protein